MASKEGDYTGDSMTATTTLGDIETGKEMPPVEPGHKGHSLNSGEVYDPNAARRHKEGRGPGLQDSEIKDPAHWTKDVPPWVDLEREVDRRKAELKQLEDDLKEAKKGA